MEKKLINKPVIAIIANGLAPTKKALSQTMQDIDIIIAADGGANACRERGLIPDYIVGDLDSVDDSTLHLFNDVSVIRMPDQNLSDLQKAITFALSKNPEKVKIISAFGKRSDHTFSNLLHFASMDLPVAFEIFDNFGRLIILQEGTYEISGTPGQPVSLISITPITNLTTTGFKYKVLQKSFNPFFNGTSNEFVKATATIQFDSGRLLVYFPSEEEL